mmetsp:Transcript_122636/g.392571  ORF Transcript_122636/g.392571 Transcript_122636/m.392571 type:complete len:355 (-) Transcript_122636:312-1376(-)
MRRSSWLKHHHSSLITHPLFRRSLATHPPAAMAAARARGGRTPRGAPLALGSAAVALVGLLCVGSLALRPLSAAFASAGRAASPRNLVAGATGGAVAASAAAPLGQASGFSTDLSSVGFSAATLLLLVAVSGRTASLGSRSVARKASVVCCGPLAPVACIAAQKPCLPPTQIISIAEEADLLALSSPASPPCATPVLTCAAAAVTSPVIARAALPQVVPGVAEGASASFPSRRPAPARFVGAARRSHRAASSPRSSTAARKASRRQVGSRLTQRRLCVAEPQVLSYDSSRQETRIQSGLQVQSRTPAVSRHEVKVKSMLKDVWMASGVLCRLTSKGEEPDLIFIIAKVDPASAP